MKLPFQPDLKNKVAVVTGGAGVLCAMFAHAIGLCGAKVAVLDLNLERAKIVADEINAGVAQPSRLRSMFCKRIAWRLRTKKCLKSSVHATSS